MALGSALHRPSRKALKRTVLGLVAIAAVAAAGYFAYDYWKVGRFLHSTTNAYVRADYTIVAPKISGYVTQVLVQDNEPVTAGQVIAVIDDRDFRVQLDQAQADIDLANAALRNIDAQIAQQQSALDQEAAGVTSDEASLTFAQADHTRYRKLKRAGYGSVQRAQQAETTMREKSAALQRSRASLVVAERHIDVLTSERGRFTAQRERALATYHQAELNLSYTAITAPMSGTVGARALRVGQYVQSGTPLMAVVPLQAVYVVGNFKETQLAHVHSGQAVEVLVDSFPGFKLKGHVDSISPASGQEFSLLPADNATGNFVKIVQRVPVKIVIDDNPLAGRLRPGMSVEAIIDTRDRR
jgi:membrane fusion protein (multidrug efflux system)